MFADLTSSTTYAEQLGREKYSLLIQECFRIANKIVPQHDAQIYQYVGDEIVICWLITPQFEPLAPLDFFFAVQENFEVNREHYYSEYGFVPEFLLTNLNQKKVKIEEVKELDKVEHWMIWKKQSGTPRNLSGTDKPLMDELVKAVSKIYGS